ncbi:MAG: arylsulfatase [Bacteroidia bacterium]|nr:arylsulfatase [Bacteroidia bacterium]
MKKLAILIWFCLCSGLIVAQGDSAFKAPNIVIILLDDAGIMDLGVYGGEAATPHIDALAQQGMMFTNYHSSPVCAPSRAMLLTGSDSHLTGIPNIPEFLSEDQQRLPGYQGILNDKVKTIATRLKGVGYNTYMTGKWHLGHTENTLPSKRGFDRTFILDASGADNYEAKGYLPINSSAQWHQDGKTVDLPEDFYSSKAYVDKMIGFMDEEKEKENPFFAFLSFQAVHIPVQAPKEFVAKYSEVYKDGWFALRQARFEKAKQLKLIPQAAALGDMLPVFRKWEKLSEAEQREAANDMAVHAAMLEAMDFHLGRFIEYLKGRGFYDNTLFVITSDNGPEGGYPQGLNLVKAWMKFQGYHRDEKRLGEKGYYGAIGTEFASATASPFAFFKTYTGEGGLRVPLIMTGKNIPQGQKDAFTMVTDIVPTLLERAGLDLAKLNSEVPITGRSINPLLEGKADSIYSNKDAIGIESAGSAALFKGDWKIMRNSKPHGDVTWRLYNLKNDPGETIDLSRQEPEIFADLISDYADYAQRVGVQEMGVHYEAHKVVLAKAIKKLGGAFIKWLLVVLCLIVCARQVKRFITRRN